MVWQMRPLLMGNDALLLAQDALRGTHDESEIRFGPTRHFGTRCMFVTFTSPTSRPVSCCFSAASPLWKATAMTILSLSLFLSLSLSLSLSGDDAYVSVDYAFHVR